MAGRLSPAYRRVISDQIAIEHWEGDPQAVAMITHTILTHGEKVTWRTRNDVGQLRNLIAYFGRCGPHGARTAGVCRQALAALLAMPSNEEFETEMRMTH